MKIFILTDGGADTGLGHVSRCVALAQSFKRRKSPAALIINGDKSLLPLLGGSNYKMFNWHDDQGTLLKIIKSSDITVVDSYLAGPLLNKEIAASTKLPVYLDDTKRAVYPKGIIVNGSIGAEKMGYKRKKGVKYLLGMEYAYLRKPFWTGVSRRIKKNIRDVLITFGGTSQDNIISVMVDFLSRKFPQMRFNIVSNKIDACSMKELMLDSDIAISAGGQTLYELARIGTPTICICIADNQLNNIRGWQKAGFIEYAGWRNDARLLRKVYKALNTIYSFGERVKRSDAGRRMIDGRGVHRIVDALLG